MMAAEPADHPESRYTSPFTAEEHAAYDQAARAYIGGVLGARSRLHSLSETGPRSSFFSYLGAQHAGIIDAINWRMSAGTTPWDGLLTRVSRLSLATWLMDAKLNRQARGAHVPFVMADYGDYLRTAGANGCLGRTEEGFLTQGAQHAHWRQAMTVVHGALRHSMAVVADELDQAMQSGAEVSMADITQAVQRIHAAVGALNGLKADHLGHFHTGPNSSVLPSSDDRSWTPQRHVEAVVDQLGRLAREPGAMPDDRQEEVAALLREHARIAVRVEKRSPGATRRPPGVAAAAESLGEGPATPPQTPAAEPGDRPTRPGPHRFRPRPRNRGPRRPGGTSGDSAG